MNTQNVEAIDGKVLLERLAALESKGLTTVDQWFTNEARSEKPIAAAQKVLEQAGYQLSEWATVEPDFYQLIYTPVWRVYPYMNHWPYWIKLRMISGGLFGPQLALVYYDEGVLQHYTGSYVYTSGSKSSDAEKMEFHFRAEHPDVEPLWLPVFDQHFPVVDRSE